MSPTATRPRPPASKPAGERRKIDPRISARRTAVSREQGRRRLHVLMAGLAGTALLVGAYMVLMHTPVFAARAITVIGATHETSAQVEQAGGLATHPPLLGVNQGAVAQRIEKLPWVQSAAVSVHWPDGVRVVVHEELPRLAMAVAGGQWATVASDGKVLALSAARPAGLLTFSGPSVPKAAGSVLGPKDAVGLAVASTLPPSFAAQVTGVTVEPGGWVQLSMNTPIVVDVGNATQLSAKYEDVSALLAGATLHTCDVLDVSVPQAPTVTKGCP